MKFKKTITSQDGTKRASITLHIYKNIITGELMASTFASLTPLMEETTGQHINIAQEDWLLIKSHYGNPGTPIIHDILTKYLTLFLINTGKRIPEKSNRELFYQQFFKEYAL